MIKNTDNLGHFISTTLESRPTVRIFADVLNCCWDLPKQGQEAAIRDFAQRHDWTVTVDEPFDIGLLPSFPMPMRPGKVKQVRKGLEARLS
jgi:hypothetical protein